MSWGWTWESSHSMIWSCLQSFRDLGRAPFFDSSFDWNRGCLFYKRKICDYRTSHITWQYVLRRCTRWFTCRIIGPLILQEKTMCLLINFLSICLICAMLSPFCWLLFSGTHHDLIQVGIFHLSTVWLGLSHVVPQLHCDCDNLGVRHPHL